jgi:hypothetical protein
MGKHAAPVTGNGRTSGEKISKSQCAIITANGAVKWVETAQAFGSKSKGSDK